MVLIADKSSIGKVVITAGWVNLDLEQSSSGFNVGSLRQLPPGYKMILKAIKSDYAFTYHHNNGVMRIPYNLLEPWE